MDTHAQLKFQFKYRPFESICALRNSFSVQKIDQKLNFIWGNRHLLYWCPPKITFTSIKSSVHQILFSMSINKFIFAAQWQHLLSEMEGKDRLCIEATGALHDSLPWQSLWLLSNLLAAGQCVKWHVILSSFDKFPHKILPKICSYSVCFYCLHTFIWACVPIQNFRPNNISKYKMTTKCLLIDVYKLLVFLVEWRFFFLQKGCTSRTVFVSLSLYLYLFQILLFRRLTLQTHISLLECTMCVLCACVMWHKFVCVFFLLFVEWHDHILLLLFADYLFTKKCNN